MIMENRLITALDVPNLDKASRLVMALGGSVQYYKVGMELFYGTGNEIIKYLKGYNKKVFLDLKLHDIPNTVGSAVRVLTALDVDMMNLHVTGGREMMKAAVKAAKEAACELDKEPPAIIGVTVLTSIGSSEWQELNYKLSIKEQVIEISKLAKDAGLSGVVASPEEAGAIKKACGNDFLIVTPGIRMAGDSKDDQSRIATPKDAMKEGATHIVVGRPINRADDPKAAAKAIIENMREAVL